MVSAFLGNVSRRMFVKGAWVLDLLVVKAPFMQGWLDLRTASRFGESRSHVRSCVLLPPPPFEQECRRFFNRYCISKSKFAEEMRGDVRRSLGLAVVTSSSASESIKGIYRVARAACLWRLDALGKTRGAHMHSSAHQQCRQGACYPQ